MKTTFFSMIAFLLLLSGCSKDNPLEPDNKSAGSIVLKIDRENAPASVVTVVAKLTRSGFNPISSEMNLLSDSTADLNLNNIPVGIWHLKVDAKNQSGIVEYTGDADINVIENTTIQVSLVLYPVSGGTGNIYIFVSWGQSGIWKDYPANPVLTPFQNPSYPVYVTQSKVIFDNGIYKMWYNSVYNNAVCAVWYAESSDGKLWTTIGSQPVLTPGNYNSWDSYSVAVQCVIKDNNIYKMYYSGWNDHPYSSSWNIGVAFSENGMVWTKHPQPVLSEQNKYFRLGLTSVIKHDSIYYGYLGYHNSTSTQLFIGAATSPDGINWSYYNNNPILSPDIPWEGNGIFYPSVIYENGTFKMCYQNRSESKFGMALSSTPFNFVKESIPIFSNTQSIKHWNVISYPNFIKLDNEYRIYYSGFEGYGSDGIGFISK